jgi:hypothetical protein
MHPHSAHIHVVDFVSETAAAIGRELRIFLRSPVKAARPELIYGKRVLPRKLKR